LVSGINRAIRVSGADAISFLQGLISQDVASQPGTVVRSFLLGPQGKLRALLWVLIGENEVVLITDRESAGTVVADLSRYRIRVDVEIEADPRPVLELWGPEAAAVLTGAGVEPDPGWIQTPGGWVAGIPLDGLNRFFFVGIDPDELVAAGAVRCGELAVTVLRIEAGEPKMGVDVDESTIPQESGLVPDSVSFTKGCYLGQELVARIDSRGHVNRHLRGLVLTENILPPTGAEIFSDGKSVGAVGSVGESLTLRAPVGLGLVRREVEPGKGVELRWEGGSAMATVRELPLDDLTDG
jgi:folate-binding protein YgfZ